MKHFFSFSEIKKTLLLFPVMLIFGIFFGSLISVLLFSSNPLGAAISIAQEGSFQRALLRTLRIALAVALISSILAYPTAIYINSLSSRTAKRIAYGLIWLPVMVNPVVRAYGWMLILGRYGIINSLLSILKIGELKILYTEAAVVIGLVELFTPFLIASIYSSLERVGEDLIAAARTLGAGSLQIFKDLILPLTAKGYFFGLTIVIAGSFTAYTTPVLLGGTKNMTLSMLLYLYAATLLDWNSAVGLSILMLIIVLGIIAVPVLFLRRG